MSSTYQMRDGGDGSGSGRGGGEGLFEERPAGPLPRFPVVRLLRLVMILQGRRYPNARQLAEECGVSRRTIYRDLLALESAGISVSYRADRQGYQLAGAGPLRPAQLNDEEALALLLLARWAPVDGPFGSSRPLRSAVDKVIQALPDTVRARALLDGELLGASDEATEARDDLEARRPIHEAIWKAIRQRGRMRLWYRTVKSDPRPELGPNPEAGANADAPAVLTTKFDLYRLAHVAGHWSVVGRSTRHRDVRLFRVSDIERAELTDEPYQVPPRFRIDRWLERVGGVETDGPPFEMR